MVPVTPASATALSMGLGETWVEFCEGSTKELSSEVAIEFCTMTLLSFQVGAIQQAHELGRLPTLCSRTLPPKLNERFVAWVKEKPERLKQDFLFLYPQFLKEINECEI
jgi:hypothetical protein